MSKYQNDNFLIIADIVHQLTHTSNKILNENQLNELKIICREGNEFIDRTHTLLIDCLAKKHSEIRYNAFQVCCMLFEEYSYYRIVFTNDIQRVLNLTAEVTYELPLPPPKRAADDLKRLTFQKLEHWKDLYGKEHEGLNLYYSLLKSKIKQFNDSENVTQQNTEVEKKRMEIVNYERIRLLRDEITDVKPEIEIATRSLDSCIHMLVPTLDDFFIVESATDKASSDSNSSENNYDYLSEKTENCDRFSTTTSVNIDIKTVRGSQVLIKKTDENSVIIENARDQVVLITNKYLPTIKKWLNIANQAKDDENLVKNIIDLKNQLETLLDKYNRLQIQNLIPSNKKEENDETDESDMEEVTPKNDISADDIIANSILQSDFPNENTILHDFRLITKECDKDSVADERGLNRINPSSSTSVIGNQVLPDVEKAETIWDCRAPLQNGKLCQRRDKIKCPFHGVIVPRDKTGKCSNLADAAKEQELLNKKQLVTPDWQDPTLLAEIKHTTGVDLKMPERGKRMQRKQSNDLTDINAFKNTPYYRLSKKIFKSMYINNNYNNKHT